MTFVEKDCFTTDLMNFFQFFSNKSKFPEEEQNFAHLRNRYSKFICARNVITSNPFHLGPITEVESMEDVLGIQNSQCIEDQLKWVFHYIELCVTQVKLFRSLLSI